MKLRSAMFVLALGGFAAGADSAELKLKLPLGLQESAAYIPDDNPLTPEKIALGKQFFWDTRWSRNGTIACVSCHDPKHGWGDARQFLEACGYPGGPAAGRLLLPGREAATTADHDPAP